MFPRLLWSILEQVLGLMPADQKSMVSVTIVGLNDGSYKNGLHC